MPRPFRLLAATAAFALAASCASAQPGDTGKAQIIADALLQALVETSGVPGMAASYTHNGELVWTGVAGLRDVETGLPVAPDTEFRFASVSKLMTATAAARLVQAGRLDPDAPVQTALPYIDNDWPAISARQLAAHISGIPHYQAVDRDRGDVHYAHVRDAIGVFSGRDLLSPPGAAYHYSSFGYTLLSAAVEAAAGEPFLDFVRRDVTAGLAIRPVTAPSGPLDTAPYEFVDGQIRRAGPHDYSYSYGGAGFRGSAPALAMFGARVLSEDFISAATRAFLWTPATTADGATVMEDQDAVGFGWRIGVDASDERIVHHAGVTTGARSALVLYPDTGDSVSVLSNALWVAAIEGTATILASPFRVDATENAAAAACPTGISRFEGRYRGARIEGEASLAVVDGVCRGAIAADNPMGEWFNGFLQADAERLPVIALTADGKLGRAALVTPAGLYDFRCSPPEDCRAVFGPQRVLEIAFR
jgi:serine beta-lactamase-like protein LACTB